MQHFHKQVFKYSKQIVVWLFSVIVNSSFTALLFTLCRYRGLQQHEQVSVPMSYVRSADKVAVVAVPAILISLAFWLITHLHIYVQLLRSPRPGPGSSTFTIIHSLITS